MAIDAHEIIEKIKLRGETNKVRVGMYLRKDLYEAFKLACGKISISQTIEEMMRQFVASAKGTKGKK